MYIMRYRSVTFKFITLHGRQMLRGQINIPCLVSSPSQGVINLSSKRRIVAREKFKLRFGRIIEDIFIELRLDLISFSLGMERRRLSRFRSDPDAEYRRAGVFRATSR